MAAVIIRSVSVLYGLVGAASLVTFFLYLVYGPSVTGLRGISIFLHAVFLSIALGNTVAGLSIMYGLWRFRRWAARLAISFNALYLSVFVAGFAYSVLFRPGELTGAAVVFMVVIVSILGGIIVLCAMRSIRDLTDSAGRT